MDGLGSKSDCIFLLTTNRPEILEPALAARPGRVDQAIYFPLPDIAEIFTDLKPGDEAVLLRILPRVRRGTHVGHPLVTCLKAWTVTLDAEGIVAYADGERLGPLPLTATAVPGALTLFGS